MIKRQLLLSVIGIAAVICGNDVAQAQNKSVIGNWQFTKETSYPSLCEAPQIELFSCRLTTKRIVSLCLDNQSRKFQFRFEKAQGTPVLLPFYSLYQIVNAVSGGSSMIVQGRTTRGTLTLFYSNNYADGEANNAIQFAGQAADYCLDPTIRDPVNLVQGPEGGTQESINIWLLQNFGMVKPFFDRTTGRRDETTIWRMWPSKNSIPSNSLIDNP